MRAWVENTLARMSLRQKIGQLILTGVPDDELKSRACEQIQMLRPAGITFQSGNIQDPEQLRRFTQALENCSKATNPVPMIFTLAHEGENTRFMSGATPFPSALAQAATGDPEAAFAMALAAGKELKYSGINMILGPVADVLTELDNEVIYDRTYGGEPLQASAFVEKAVLGYESAGLIPVLKHFPGHGGVSADSHVTLPVDRSSRSIIEADYLPPFKRGLDAGAPVVMLSHIAYPALSGAETPATLSPQIVQYLRSDLGFNGVILSDSMRMKAVNTQDSSVEQASLAALQSGVDLLLLNEPSQARITRNYLYQAATEGKLSQSQIDAAVRRVLMLKASWGLISPEAGDVPAPNWEAHRQLLEDFGERIPVLLKDDLDYVPLPFQSSRILIIAPRKEWNFYADLEQALIAHGHTPEYVFYSPPWEEPVKEAEYLTSLPARMADYDVTLVFTWNAYLLRVHYDESWQAELVHNLSASGRPLVAAALSSPTDLLAFPEVPAFIAMLGTTPGQQRAVIQALVGEADLTGQNPLPGLVP